MPTVRLPDGSWGDTDLPGKWGRGGFGWGDTDLPGSFQGGGNGFTPPWGDTDLPRFQGGGQGFRPPPVGALAGPQGVPAPVAQPPGASINSNPMMQPHMLPNGQPEMLDALPAPSATGWGLNINPYARGAIAAAGIMAPTPAETGELTPEQRARGLGPMAAGSPHGGIGSDANSPVLGAAGDPSTYAAPGQQPAMLDPTAVPYPPPRPRAAPRAAPRGSSGKKRIAPATVNAGTGAPGWVTQDMQDTSPNQRNRPQMGMFDLSTLFKKK